MYVCMYGKSLTLRKTQMYRWVRLGRYNGYTALLVHRPATAGQDVQYIYNELIRATVKVRYSDRSTYFTNPTEDDFSPTLSLTTNKVFLYVYLELQHRLKYSWVELLSLSNRLGDALISTEPFTQWYIGGTQNGALQRPYKVKLCGTSTTNRRRSNT